MLCRLVTFKKVSGWSLKLMRVTEQSMVSPDITVVLNYDWDHVDQYEEEESLNRCEAVMYWDEI